MASLANKIEIWGFESGFTVFRDGSLGFGLECSLLNIDCWDEASVDGLGPKLTSLLNGLTPKLDIQFVLSIGKGDGDKIARHQKLGVSKQDTVKMLTQSRVNAFQQVELQGLAPMHTLKIFVRQPFSQSPQKTSYLFNKSASFPKLTENALEREIERISLVREDLVRQLEGVGLEVESLSERRLIEMVYRQWNPSRLSELIAYDPEDIRGSLLFTDAVISDKGFRLSNTHYRVLSLKLLPDQTFSAMANMLASLPFETETYLSIHIPDQQKELEYLHTQRRLAFSMARGSQHGVSDIGSETKFKEVEDLLEQMVAQGEKVFLMSLQVLLRGSSEEKLDFKVSQTLASLRELGGAEAMEETLAAFDIFSQFALPNARSPERQKRVKTSNLVDFIPFYGPWKGHELPRILLRSAFGGVLGIDPFTKELSNYNQMITGGSGSGKSFMTNLCLLQMLKESPKVFIVDIGGSYKKLSENLSGQYISFHLNTDISLNPFDLQPGELQLSSEKVKFLVGLIELMTKEEEVGHIGRLERSEIEEAIQSIYSSGKEPTLSLLREKLLTHPEAEIRRFGRILSSWCGGSPFGKIVDRKSSIELKRDIVCFDLKGLESCPELQAVCLYIITDYVWREVQRERGRMKFLILDECWKLLESNAGASFIGEVFRTFRKYYASAIAISQNIDDFAKSKIASAILPNTSIKWILSQKGADFKRLQEVLDLNDNEISAIAALHQERGVYSQALLMAGDNHSVVHITPTPLEYWVATTDPRDLALIEERQKSSNSASQLELLESLSRELPLGVAAGEA